MLASPISQIDPYIEKWIDCYMSDTKRSGYVCLFHPHWKKMQTFYGLNDKEKMIDLASRKKDVYLSLNAFEYGKRDAEHLKQIRNIGIDLDCYNKGLTDVQTIEHVKGMIFSGKIPNPNLVIWTSRGIQLIYSISGGLPPNMAFLTSYITHQIMGTMLHLGADAKCVDVSRVLRMPGSIHSKTGQIVKAETWRSMEYTIDDLYQYVTPMEQTKRKTREKGKIIPMPSQKGVRDTYSMNQKKYSDLAKLVEIRQGDMTGMRNDFLYIFTFAVHMYQKSETNTHIIASQMADQIHSRIDKPMKDSEIRNTIKSATNDAQTFLDHWMSVDHKISRVPRNVIKPMKTQTVIERLQITDAEAELMQFLLTDNERQKRDRERKRATRRANGVQERSKYLDDQKQATDGKLESLAMILEQNPGIKQAEIAQMLNVNKSTVSRLIKKLQGVSL